MVPPELFIFMRAVDGSRTLERAHSGYRKLIGDAISSGSFCDTNCVKNLVPGRDPQKFKNCDLRKAVAAKILDETSEYIYIFVAVMAHSRYQYLKLIWRSST